MKITLKPELFETEYFQASFKEKLKSARYYDYAGNVKMTKDEIDHYNYGRAAKGALAEFGFMGLLWMNDIYYQYNKKLGKHKYAPDVDFILHDDVRIDVKSGFSFWKPASLVKYKINYVVVASPELDNLPGVYKKNYYTLIQSYRQLFKNAITIDIQGFVPAVDVINAEDTNSYTQHKCQPIMNLFYNLGYIKAPEPEITVADFDFL
jgi:hypothetical protein